VLTTCERQSSVRKSGKENITHASEHCAASGDVSAHSFEQTAVWRTRGSVRNHVRAFLKARPFGSRTTFVFARLFVPRTTNRVDSSEPRPRSIRVIDVFGGHRRYRKPMEGRVIENWPTSQKRVWSDRVVELPTRKSDYRVLGVSHHPYHRRRSGTCAKSPLAMYGRREPIRPVRRTRCRRTRTT